jgi:two-component system LytT family response regulator
MTKAIIIEDEKLASQYLISRLKELAPDIEVETTLTDVAGSINFLSKGTNADIIFCDVQLADGLSFSIFKNVQVNMPVIFITAYDKFIMNAFKSNGIDYLLKPVSDEDLLEAVNKYRMLEKHFSSGNHHTLDMAQHSTNGKKPARMIVKRGQEHLFLLMEDIVLFYTENKVVYIIDKNGKKYLVDKNLSDLEEELDTDIFFRANRQYIVNINYVKGYKTYERVKLQLELHLNLNHCIVISQETAPLFRKWIYNA